MKKYVNKLIKLDKKFGAQNYKPLPIVLNRGSGVHVFDVENKMYYDFLSSYSSINQGHCHPKLIKAINNQSKKLTLCSRAFYSENLSLFYKYMNSTFKYDKCLPMNSGVEAVETSIKLARLWGYKHKGIENDKAEIIVANNNFWGRSLAACSSSNDPLCYNNFGPFMPGFSFVDFNNILQLEDKLKNNTNIVAFIVEPIQGEAGIILPNQNYLEQCSELCKKYNVLFICDEVQTGIGRTGKMLVSENIKPDMVVLGKALSGGIMPISCVLGNNQVMDLVKPGIHGSTFGGNPLAAYIAPKAIDIIFEENLLENAINMGNLFRDELTKENNKLINDIRGVGLLNAIEFINDDVAEIFVRNCMKNGLLTKVTKNNTVRMCPPLVINKSEMENSLNIIFKSINQI